MKYLFMGESQVSVVGLGTWQFGEPGWGWGSELDYETAIKIVHRALELGINFFDTAEVYGSGKSEEILGEALEGSREQAFIATKVAPPLRPDRIMRSATDSLSRLKVEAIDLYQLHAPDRNVPLERTMRAIRKLLDEGYIRQVGVSNFTLQQWQQAEEVLGSPIISNQVQYHLLNRQARNLLPYAHDTGKIVTAFSPLAQGLLSGKYGFDNVPRDLRANFGIFNDDSLRRAPEILNVLSEVSGHHQSTPAQVALAWLLLDSQVMVIPGARTIEQIECNAGSSDLKLTPGETMMIDQATRV